MATNDPAEALTQIKAEFEAAGDEYEHANWALHYGGALVEVAASALEYEPAVVRYLQTMREKIRGQDDQTARAHALAIDAMRTKHLALLEALEALGQRAGDEG